MVLVGLDEEDRGPGKVNMARTHQCAMEHDAIKGMTTG